MFAWSNSVELGAVETMRSDVDTERAKPSEGLFTTESSSSPGCLATNVVDPPPSRLTASTQPASYKICAISCMLPPQEKGS